MGQYHAIYNRTKKEYLSAHEFDAGMKLAEFTSSYLMMSGFALLLANSNGRGGGDICAPYEQKTELDQAKKSALELMSGRWAGDSIVIQGDYAKPSDPAFISEEDLNSDEWANISAALLQGLAADDYFANEYKLKFKFTPKDPRKEEEAAAIELHNARMAEIAAKYVEKKPAEPLKLVPSVPASTAIPEIPHDLKPGDLLVRKWGATMARFEFFQVLSVNGSRVFLGFPNVTSEGSQEGNTWIDSPTLHSDIRAFAKIVKGKLKLCSDNKFKVEGGPWDTLVYTTVGKKYSFYGD